MKKLISEIIEDKSKDYTLPDDLVDCAMNETLKFELTVRSFAWLFGTMQKMIDKKSKFQMRLFYDPELANAECYFMTKTKSDDMDT